MNRAFQFLAVVSFGFFGVCTAALVEPVVFDLDGREAVVLVQKHKRPRDRRKKDKLSVTIKGRTVKAEIADANEFTYFQIGRNNHK